MLRCQRNSCQRLLQTIYDTKKPYAVVASSKDDTYYFEVRHPRCASNKSNRKV